MPQILHMIVLNRLMGQNFYLAHVIEQANFRIPNPQYFVYLLAWVPTEMHRIALNCTELHRVAEPHYIIVI